MTISWIEKAENSNIRQNFCNRSHFFAGQQTAEKWLTENNDANISNVEEFFTFARGGRGCC
jgi:hypothetical protein